MDTNLVEEVLDGKRSLNMINRQGELISEPKYVYVVYVNGNENGERYGSNSRPTESLLDYAVHRNRGVSLKEKTNYYEENDVKVKIYYIDGGDLVFGTWGATNNGWNKMT